jgi:hypothetical protein
VSVILPFSRLLQAILQRNHSATLSAGNPAAINAACALSISTRPIGVRTADGNGILQNESNELMTDGYFLRRLSSDPFAQCCREQAALDLRHQK